MGNFIAFKFLSIFCWNMEQLNHQITECTLSAEDYSNLYPHETENIKLTDVDIFLYFNQMKYSCPKTQA